MITKEKILEVLKNNSQKSVIGSAVEEDDFELVAEELVKNCSIPDVVGRSGQLPEDEEETKCPDHTPYWGVCSTCGQY